MGWLVSGRFKSPLAPLFQSGEQVRRSNVVLSFLFLSAILKLEEVTFALVFPL